MDKSKILEQLGAELAVSLIDKLLTSGGQAESCRSIIAFLDDIGSFGECSMFAARGAATALVDVLQQGVKAIRKEAA
jgi:hypothetical protein